MTTKKAGEPKPLTQWWRSGVRALLARLFAKPLLIRIGNNTYAFRSPRGFEFALCGRTTVPLEKYQELMSRPADQLRREAISIKTTERRFVEILERCLEDPACIATQLRELGPKVFSKDHQWRSIAEAFSGDGAEFDEYRRLTLVKYLQYLSARQEVLNTIFQIKTNSELGEYPDLSAEPMPSLGTKETVIFDLMHIQDSHRLLNPYERLPRGEPVLLRLKAGQSVDIVLAKNHFRLVAGDTYLLVADNGTQYALHPGRNVVGRNYDNDVAIDGAYRAVSRRHLIIEPLSDSTARLIDMSSHGTFLPPQYLDTVH